jgi:gliding motility-associated-like protein
MVVRLLKMPKIPNTFSPNNDGINDHWLISYLDSYPNCHLKVFTKSGQMVYETKGYSDATAWDGNYRGKSLPVDTYYYILEPGSGRQPITGFVTIIK